MKRFGGLFESVTSFENLLLAAQRAQSGKRFREDVLSFNHNRERNLIDLQRELLERTYVHGGYKRFIIFEPKRRIISAAPYRDRVVHHALNNITAPLFDRSMSESSYANRAGRGTHKALDHFKRGVRRFRYCLRADIEKYFPSIDHQLLREKMRHKIKCMDTLWLVEAILSAADRAEDPVQYFGDDSLFTPLERSRGLPIGNLTSQLWANIYLNAVDHALTREVGGARYVRYVDDFALFSDDASELASSLAGLRDLLGNLRLRLHPVKTQITETRLGVNFLGFRVFPDHIRLRQDNLRRVRRRFKKLALDYRQHRVSWHEVKQSLQSWNAHAAYGDTYRLRERVFGDLVFARR